MSVLLDNGITIYEALEHIKNGKYVMLDCKPTLPFILILN